MHVVGSGELESDFAALESEADRTSPVSLKYWGKFSVSDRMEFFTRFFSRIDYLVVPTQDESEGIPGVILESLQFGVPVVTTRTGGIAAFEMKELGPCREVVRLVPKDDFPRSLSKLASEPLPSETIAQKCKAYYARYFSDAVLRGHWSKLLRPARKAN